VPSRKNFSTYRRLPRAPRLRRPRSRRRRLMLRFGAGLGVAGLVVAASVPASLSGFSARATNSTGTSYGAGSLVLSATANGSTCTTSPSTISTDTNSNCAGTLFPSVLGTSSSSSSITVANAGNLTASSVALTSSSSCGVLTSPDSSSAADNPAIATAGVQTTSTAPFTGSSALAFDGSSGYLQTEQSFNEPQTYSLAAWFETPSGGSGGGSVISFSSQQSNSYPGYPGHWDRMVWVDSSGHVDFGVYDGSNANVITSSSAYNDGSWHFVVATASSAGTALYVDGTKVASSSSYTVSEDYGGWWSIGWSNVLSGAWSPDPNQDNFNGDIADVAVFPTALSSAAVTTLYGASSQSTESSRILADSPTSYWPLASVSSSTTGNMENLGTTLPDLSANNNTATVQGELTSSTSSKFSDGSAVEFEDADAGYLQTASQQNNPQTFSIAGWFKTPSGGGGTIAGFTNTQSDGSASDRDRALWVDSTGKVVFGIDDAGTLDEITSSSAYANNAWHFVVATLSPSAGMKLYLDGSLAASNASATAAQNYSGYWHIGWGGEQSGSWSDPPTSAYFDGEMTDVAIFSGTNGALSSTQITTLYGESSQAAEQSQITTDNPTYDWPLQTDQTVNFCGSESIYVTIESDSPTTYCIDPYQSGACPSTGANVELSSVAGESIPLANISPGANDVIKITMSDTNNAYDGMHFAIPLTLSAAARTFTASLLYPASTPQQSFQG
jgi:hypothetical protein